MSENNDEDEEEEIYRVKYKKSSSHEDSPKDDDVRYKAKFKASEQPITEPKITPDIDEEIYTYGYHPSFISLHPNINIPDETIYRIPIQATPQPIRKRIARPTEQQRRTERKTEKEELLSDDDKEKLYPHILKYLDGLVKRGYTTDEMDNIIKEISPKNDKKKEKMHEILKILFFALYKTTDKQDLITRLRTVFLDMDRNEIDELIEEIRAELKNFTEEDLYKNLRTISTDIDNEELISEDDDTIPEEAETFVNNEMETPNINVPNFRKRVMEDIKKITNLIECTKEQKKIILSKSEEILNVHISRAKNNEFTIPKNANLKIIAWTIIYIISNSDENILKINEKIPRDVYQYYHRYFSQLYPINSVNSFPLKAIKFIARYIYQNLYNNNSKDYILSKLLDLDNLSTILGSETKEYRSIQKRLNETKDSLINFFTDFIKVVAKIKELNDLKRDKEISIAKIGKKLLENNISMGYTSDTFKEHILKVIFDSLLGLEGFTLRRLKKKYKKDYQERENKLILSDKQRTLFNRSILKKYSDDITQALFLLIKDEFESIYGKISPTSLADLIVFNRPLTVEILNSKTYMTLRLYSLHKIEKSILKNNELPNKQFIVSAIQKYIEILGIRHIFLYNIIEIFYNYTGRIINITDLARIFKIEELYFGVFLGNKAENVFLNTILQLTLYIREIEAFNFRKIKLFHQDKFSNEEISKIENKIRDLKASLIQECKDFILKYIYPDSDISEEIDLIITLINFVSIVKEKHISTSILSETMGLSEGTLTTRLTRDIYFNAIELRTIKKLMNKYKTSYPDEVKECNLSIMKYINSRGIRLVSSEGYLQGWGQLFYEHCYHLVLDQLGCDLLDGDLLPIYFSEWLRHHLKFKKNSNELEDIVLTTNKKHSEAYSHPNKPNHRNPNDQSKLLYNNRELIKKLIYSYLDNENTLEKIYTELPSSWKEINKKKFIKRLKFLKHEGKDRFFEEYYKAFYELIKDSIFLGTHIFK